MRIGARFILTTAIVTTTIVAAVPSVAAQMASREPRWRLGLELIRSEAWDLEVRTGTFLNREASYEAGWSLGLKAGFDPLTQATVFAAAEWDGGGYGDSSGWSLWAFGAEARPLRGRLVQPRITASAGRASESGGVRFGIGTLGAGVDVRLGRHLAAGAAAELLRSFSPQDTRTGPPGTAPKTATVDADMVRLRFGLTARF